jgi:CheY-like chemotaxis protein
MERSDGGADAPAPLRILVIDGNASWRETLRALLTRLGHDVEAAADSEQGLASVWQRAPDVALIGVSLPGVLEVVQRVRDVLGRYTSLVAMGSVDDPEQYRLARDLGFDLFLRKPLPLEGLSAWLGEVAAGLTWEVPSGGAG